MSRAGAGDLTVFGNVNATDEFGDLCATFNLMIRRQSEVVGKGRQSAVELAAASEEMAASTEEVTATTNSIAKNIQQVADEVRKLAEPSNQGAICSGRCGCQTCFKVLRNSVERMLLTIIAAGWASGITSQPISFELTLPFGRWKNRTVLFMNGR